jgi:predicted dehydrogenase
MFFRSTRRSFLATSLSGAAALSVLPSAQVVSAYQANDRLRLAVFGNMYNAAHFLTAAHTHNADIVAICNPDQRKTQSIFNKWDEQAKKLAEQDQPQRRAAAQQYQQLAAGRGVTVYQDVRRMFDELEQQIDALVVSDYDHFHGITCGAAMRLGKPVCSERPLGLTINEARALRTVAAETKVATTYRSPGTGSGQFRRAMELVGDGAIGDVHEVHIWFDRGGPDRDRLPEGSQPVPEGLDWDLWLGPLPQREYHPDWMSYAHWRETSNGGLGSFGPHTSIFAFMTLKLRELWQGSPGETAIRVSAQCSRLNRVSYPRWERVRWELPARGTMPPVTITWHHGPKFAPGSREIIHQHLRNFGITSEQEADQLMRSAGSMLVGSDGALVADDHSVHVTALPRDKFAEIETDRPLRTPASQGIYGDWIDACRGGNPHILANFDNGGPLSEMLMLGNIATQFPEQTLIYDPVSGQIADHPEANEKLGYQYRAGWQI